MFSVRMLLGLTPMLAVVIPPCVPDEIIDDIRDPNVVRRGTGSIEAEGSGTATLIGRGEIFIELQEDPEGRAHLVIHDAANKDVTLNGQGTKYWRGDHLYVDGLVGTATIAGEGLVVGVTGHPLYLYAEGSGRVSLAGVGTYSVNGGEEQPWPTELQEIAYEGAPEEE